MGKSMMFDGNRGGIFIHKNDEIYVPDYDEKRVFSDSENETKINLINALIRCYREGRLVNVRRHLAVSNVANQSEKCVFEWNDETICLSEAEIIVEENSSVHYFKTSLIYNVFKYGYKPDSKFTQSILSQFS